MKCGQFRAKADKRVTIQERVTTTDDLGGQSLTWSDERVLWAMMRTKSGRELYIQDNLQSRVDTVFVIRYVSEYKSTASFSNRRITYDGRVFAIRYIRNLDESLKDEGSQFQEIHCEENGAEVLS